MFFDEELIDINSWCPLDDGPVQAPSYNDSEPVSEGNFLVVPSFIRDGVFDDWMDDFLNLDKAENRYLPNKQLEEEFSDTCESVNQGLQFEPLPALIPMLPQQVEQEQNFEFEVEGNKIFNNQPGFLISALQCFKENIEFHDFCSLKIGISENVKRCLQEMIDNVLMKLSSKQGNREQLRMVFNDLSGKFYETLKKKSPNNKMIRKFFQLQEKYGPEIMAEAKCELREVFCKKMTKEWMHCHAMNRRFGGNNVETKKKVFYKYLVNFTQQLYEGEIQPLVNREKVLSIELFQE